MNFNPTALKRSSIPEEFLADVSLIIAPISFAYPLPLSSLTCSVSYKSALFAANAMTVEKFFYYINIFNITELFGGVLFQLGIPIIFNFIE